MPLLQMEQTNSNVALIVGVTGMAGLAIAEALKGPAALGGPWAVYGAARRPRPEWFPSSTVDEYITFDAADVDNTRRQLSPVRHLVTHVFWVAINVTASEDANVATNSAMLANVLDTLLEAPDSRLRHVTLQTGTKHYMGPVFDPTHSCLPHDPPFMEDSARLPYSNFYYALEDLLASYGKLKISSKVYVVEPALPKSFTYSVHRSSIIMGASSRSVYNTLLTLAVYAAVCKHEGLPFRYPGSRYTWEHFCDVSDARVLAEQQIWASVKDKARNEAFNCTNGDVFTWRSMWKALSEVFEVEFVEYEEEFDVVKMMEDKGKVWDEIVEKHGLYKTKMEEVCCFAAAQTVLHFGFQHVCSMNKSRDFGFMGHVDTLKSIGFWVNRLRQMNIVPSI